MPPIASISNGNELQADAAILDDCASDSLEHSNPANKAQPPNSGSSLLEDLPDELLMEICEHLVHDGDHSTDEPASRDVALHSLCLVSRRIDAIARSHLFKYIYIANARKLIKLYRTIAGDQHLSGQIKEMDLNIELDITELDPAELKTLRDRCCQNIDDAGAETSDDTVNDCDLVCILSYKLLALAVNLSSLVLRIDPEDAGRRGLYRSGIYWAFSDRVRDATRSAAGGGSAVFLPRLKELNLCSINGWTGSIVFKAFWDLPSLRTIRSMRDYGDWYNLLPRVHGDGWAARNITTLDLTYSRSRQHDLEDVAQLFPCLEILSVESECFRRGRLAAYITRGSRRGELSTRLGRLTALRTLKLNFYPNFPINNDFYNDIIESLGPGSVLSLAQLPILQHLEVSLYMFAHTAQLDLDGTITVAVPHKTLPRSLKSLVLLAQLGCEEGPWIPVHGKSEACWDSADAALKFLESFVHDLPCFPNLESVAYCFRTLSCGNPFSSAVQGSQEDEAAEDSVLPRLQAIHASFTRHNVQFLLQEGNFLEEASDRRTINLEVSEE